MSQTIKDYAENRQISYEAVRKQIKRYSKELKGLTYKHGRTTFLTDEAATFLDDHRQEKTIVVEQSDDKERIERLRIESERLKSMIIELQQQLANEKDARIALLENKNNDVVLLENKNSDLESKNSDLDKELKKFHKTIFGLYKKVE